MRHTGFKRRVAYRYPIYMLLQTSKPDAEPLEAWQMAKDKDQAMEEMEQMAMEEYPELYPNDIFLRIIWPSSMEMEEYDFE